MDRERNVILEEINMYEDSPEDVAAELFLQALWPQHPYGRPISGTSRSVQGVSRRIYSNIGGRSIFRSGQSWP